MPSVKIEEMVTSLPGATGLALVGPYDHRIKRYLGHPLGTGVKRCETILKLEA